MIKIIDNTSYYLDISGKPDRVILFYSGKSGRNERDPYSRRIELVREVFKDNFIGIYPKVPYTSSEWPLKGINYVPALSTAEKLLNLYPDVAKKTVMGISNGGCFAHAVVNELKLDAKLISVAANLWIPTINIHPTSALLIHGALDNSVPYNGGIAHKTNFMSHLQTFSAYRQAANITISETEMDKTKTHTKIQGNCFKVESLVFAKAAHNVWAQFPQEINAAIRAF